jgi:predicted MPP superfamily phosphohydrolase
MKANTSSKCFEAAAPQTVAAPPKNMPRKWTRRSLLRAAVRGGIGVAGATLGGVAWASQIEPERWQIERHALSLPRLPRAFNGFTIVQLSDFHWDEEPNPERLHAIVDAVNALSPDLIVLTGDYVSVDPTLIVSVMSAALGRLKARNGVWAVLGNHDQNAPAAVRRMLIAGNVRELRNAVQPLRRGQSTLWLCGLDSISRDHHDLSAVLNALPSALTSRPISSTISDAAILLVHEPDYADISAPLAVFDLELSGHSHGGQVRVPVFGPLLLPPGAQKYHSGLYQFSNSSGGMMHYTTRGVGTVGLHLRFCCPPEITFLTLKCGPKVL